MILESSFNYYDLEYMFADKMDFFCVFLQWPMKSWD